MLPSLPLRQSQEKKGTHLLDLLTHIDFPRISSAARKIRPYDAARRIFSFTPEQTNRRR